MDQWWGLPLVVSLSRIKKAPTGLSVTNSWRSASFRLSPLKNHLGMHRGGWVRQLYLQPRGPSCHITSSQCTGTEMLQSMRVILLIDFSWFSRIVSNLEEIHNNTERTWQTPRTRSCRSKLIRLLDPDRWGYSAINESHRTPASAVGTTGNTSTFCRPQTEQKRRTFDSPITVITASHSNNEEA